MVDKLILAKPRGFCAGVDMAIEVVEQALEKYGKPVYVKHEIVHNVHVIADLKKKGAVFVENIDEIPEGSKVIFSAHGIPPKVREEAESRKLKSIDATCPLVTKVHSEAKRYAAEGKSIILVGHHGHVELKGTSGEAPDVTQIIETVEEAQKVQVPDPDKVVCLTQTTLSIDDTKKVLDVLKERFPNLAFPPKEDICYATQNRQNAVKEIAKETDLILIVGSKNSSNSNRMVDVAKDLGVNAYLIDDCSEIKSKWFENVKTVGLSSGASAPENVVLEVIEKIKELGANETKEITVVEENTKFILPEI
jgi:4-hydroxy-3-methylbut-2-en-1-yl diphosphate reductase